MLHYTAIPHISILLILRNLKSFYMFTITNSPLAESLSNSIWEEHISRNAITLLKYVNIFLTLKILPSRKAILIYPLINSARGHNLPQIELVLVSLKFFTNVHEKILSYLIWDTFLNSDKLIFILTYFINCQLTSFFAFLGY